jgi:hypothetical protein
MALTWNQIQAQRTARSNELNDTPAAAPTTQTDLGTTAKIQTAVVESVPKWRIDGVSAVEVSITTGKVAPVVAEPLWPSRDRPTDFPIKYGNLDTVLDATLIGEIANAGGVYTET